jgi:glyoxylase-like metal-dependent hydrolase (beta-lactamase superfamily II)
VDTTRVIEPPTAFPEPGAYDAAQMITLLARSAEARIHYTLDGSPPGASSPLFDPCRLIPMQEFGQAVPPGRRTFTVRAAARIGDQFSADRAFTYVIEPRSRDEYLSQEVEPGVRMIRDFENDKMYLVTGSRRALLIDTGMGGGDLRGHVESFIGRLPLDVVITHAHPDHIARMSQFQADRDVYLHPGDLPMVALFIDRFGYEIDPAQIKEIGEGFVFDLGDRRVRVYHVPGHSKGCLTLLDEDHGILFAGDAIGSNRPTIVDALWMQMSDVMIDEYLSTLQVFRAKVAGRIRRIYGGHNDAGLDGEGYLDHLQEAAQRLVDLGANALVPSPRPSGVWQVVSGDRLQDPNWAAINVNRDRCLTSRPDQIASLSNLQMRGAALTEAFKPAVLRHTAIVDPGAARVEVVATATSRRHAALKVNGATATSGQPVAVPLAEGAAAAISIEVASPDGSTARTYVLEVRR